MRYRTKLLLITFLLIGVGCSDQQGKSEIDMPESLPEDFSQFYQEFHSDTAFQFAHIVFPLRGLRGEDFMSSDRSEYNWTRDEWTPHELISDTEQYQFEYDMIDETMIVETIREKDGPNAMQRRFALMSDGWHLIYYIEMQPLVSTPN